MKIPQIDQLLVTNIKIAVFGEKKSVFEVLIEIIILTETDANGHLIAVKRDLLTTLIKNLKYFFPRTEPF